MVDPVWREVSKEEFDAWLKAYPRPLRFNVTRTCEPELLNWNDFSLAPMWPESMVATALAPSYPPNNDVHGWRVRDDVL